MPNVVLVSHGRRYTQEYETTGKYDWEALILDWYNFLRRYTDEKRGYNGNFTSVAETHKLSGEFAFFQLIFMW